MHAKNNFIQRQFLPVFFSICAKDACSFRRNAVFPTKRAACNINYHYTLTISCLMWSLTVINPGITFDYLIEIWISRKYILLMLSCVISSFFHQEYSKWSDAHIFLGKFGHNFYCTLYVRENHVCCLTTFGRHISFSVYVSETPSSSNIFGLRDISCRVVETGQGKLFSIKVPRLPLSKAKTR